MIRNLTPHPIQVITTDGRIRCELSVDPAGPARVEQTTLATGVNAVIGDNTDVTVPLGVTRFDPPDGLPERIAGTWLVVSLPVIHAAAAAGRSVEDLLLAAEPVRDDDTGQIIGCRHLATVALPVARAGQEAATVRTPDVSYVHRWKPLLAACQDEWVTRTSPPDVDDFELSCLTLTGLVDPEAQGLTPEGEALLRDWSE